MNILQIKKIKKKNSMKNVFDYLDENIIFNKFLKNT